MAVPVQVDLNPNTKKVDAELARIRAAAKGIDFGGGARSIEKLSRPLGKITGQATEFQKSLEASNARVLAFGASVAVINKLSDAFGALVSNTIKVEATFAKIGVILGGTQKDLQEFGRGIFDVAKSTATSFDQVAEGALELARQGLSTEESLSRVETALKLVRVAGIDSQKAVAGLTAAIKGFEGAGLTVGDIADKLAEVDTKFAVSTEDLINGLERASASARVAGVSFDELLGVVTTVQERTQRGGAVIGNAFKTIFARLGRSDTLVALEEIGIKTLDASGNVRSAIPLFQELAVKLNELGLKSVEAGDIIQKVAGVRQRDILISLVEDLTSGQSQFAKSLQVSSQAAGALDQKNQALNQTLEALISKTATSGQQLASVLGEIGFADSAKDILKGLSSVLGGITKFLDGDSIGSKFAQGLISGIGSILTGPGLALVGAIFLKLFVDLSKFGVSSLKSLLGLNKASQQQQTLQQSVLQTLLQNESVQASILRLEGDKVSQEQLLLKIYNEQAVALARVQKIAANVTPGLFSAGLRGGERGVAPTGKASGGYIAAEARDVSRGVGGAPASSKVVSIPNFAFGGGKRGTMVANTSEYIVPNFAGGGDAIFNRDMVRSMGLPAGARKINAAGGYVPNFAAAPKGFVAFMRSRSLTPRSIGSTNFDRAYTQGRYREEYDALNPTQKRNILKAEEQKTQLNKSVGQDGIPDFGILYSDTIGGTPAVTIANNKDLIKAIPVDTEPPNKLYSDIRETMVKSAINFASTLGFSPDIINDSKFARIADQNLNPGSVESAFGSVFEAAFQGALGIDQKSNAIFDLPNPAAIKKLISKGQSNGVIERLGGSLQGLLAVDVKNALNKDNLNSVSNKIKNYKKAGSGYIPNFAGGALEEAIGREQAAGLPINQIRVNQSGKLRNSKNPMGLAVTNTRDEPTGRIPSDSAARGFIPNFAKGEASKSLDKAAKSAENFSSATDGALGKILLLQTISFGLSGTFSTLGRETDGFGKKLAEVANAASSFITTLITLQAAGLVGGDSSKAITNVLGKLLGGGKGLGSAASKGFNIGKLQSTGVASAADAAKGTARLMKSFGPLAKTVFNLSKLFGRFVPFIGPVILGFQALSGLSKVFTGAGLFENFKKLAGLNKENSEAIQEEIEKRKELISQLGDPEDVERKLQGKQRFIEAVDAPGGKRTQLRERIEQNEGLFGRRTQGGYQERKEASKQLKEDRRELEDLNKRVEQAKIDAELLGKQLNKLTIGNLENDGGFKSFKSLSQLVDDIKSNLQDGLIAQKDAQLTTELANNFAIVKAELNGVDSVLKDINDLQAIQNDLQNANTEAINNSKTSILDSVKGIEEYQGIEKSIAEEFEKRFSQAKNAKEIQEALNYLAQQEQGISESLINIFRDQNGELERQLDLNKSNADQAERRKQAELEIALLRAQDKGEKLTRDAGLSQFARTGGEGGFAASPERLAAEKARINLQEAQKTTAEAAANSLIATGVFGSKSPEGELAKTQLENAQKQEAAAKKEKEAADGAFNISQSTLANEIQRAKAAAEKTKSDNETLRSLELQLAASDRLTSREMAALELQKERVENTRSQFDINQKINEIQEKINNAPGAGTDEDTLKRLEQEKKNYRPN
jgi:TP901 family phage tail tape measure protein